MKVKRTSSAAATRLSRLLPIAGLVLAAPAHASVNGADLTLVWGIPFAGILLSIALLPLLAPGFWHHHFGKISVAWALAFLLPFALQFGLAETGAQTAHALLLEYIPFIIVLFALYTVAGGIHVGGALHGTPATNTALLGLGTVLASWMGTTGAAMLMIRPVIKANDNRKHKTHVIVFFIFLVANIGGALTPLGDPPLFLGFLKGVDFFWTTSHLLLPTILLSVLLLAVFYALDSYYFHLREEEYAPVLDPTPDAPIRVQGKANFLLLALIVGAVLLSGIWRSGVSFQVLGNELALQNLVRDALLVAIAVVSLKLTSQKARALNEFTWAPMAEVAKLFLGIFITIIPVIAMLKAGDAGPLRSVVELVRGDAGQPLNAMYFTLTGVLSAFLDNAPTYLVFFNLAGGDAAVLMGPMAGTLAAISAGAVYLGAMTYIGNAPNFMVKAIAEHSGIRMPSFFGYLGWSIVVLLPCFAGLAMFYFV
jgi:Na+/H+ antiporter NhaD/arsenite permease-like protein